MYETVAPAMLLVPLAGQSSPSNETAAPCKMTSCKSDEASRLYSFDPGNVVCPLQEPALDHTGPSSQHAAVVTKTGDDLMLGDELV